MEAEADKKLPNFPDVLLWEHKVPVCFGYYYNSEKKKWYYGPMRNNKRYILRDEVEPVTEPVLQYVIPYIFCNKIFEPVLTSVDIYPGFHSACGMTWKDSKLRAVMPSLFLKVTPVKWQDEMCKEFCRFWGQERIKIERWWNANSLFTKLFLNVRSIYYTRTIRVTAGKGVEDGKSVVYPNLEMIVRGKCFTNVKCYLSGSVRFCHGREDLSRHQLYVFFKFPGWEAEKGTGTNAPGSVKARTVLEGCEKIDAVETMFRDITEVCINDKRKNIALIGPPSSGKEIIKEIIRFGKSHLYSDEMVKARSYSAAGLAPGDVMRQLFGFLGANGVERGLIHGLSGGSFFLDEVAKAHVRVRASLLRMLEAGEYFPVGSNEIAYVGDLLFICASTPEDLKKESGDEPRDFWTRVEPRIEVPDVLDRGGRKNMVMKLWVDLCDSAFDVSGIRGGRFLPESAERNIVADQYKSWVGWVEFREKTMKVRYHVGTKIRDHLETFIEEVESCKSPREIRNTLGGILGRVTMRPSRYQQSKRGLRSATEVEPEKGSELDNTPIIS